MLTTNDWSVALSKWHVRAHHKTLKSKERMKTAPKVGRGEGRPCPSQPGARATAPKATTQRRKASAAVQPASDGPAHRGSAGDPGVLARAPLGEASWTVTTMPP